MARVPWHTVLSLIKSVMLVPSKIGLWNPKSQRCIIAGIFPAFYFGGLDVR